MKQIQYTIRSISPKLDEALRQQSQQSGKSLNQVVLTALEKGAGVDASATFNDLDWFVGKKNLPPTFDTATEWLDSVPKEL